ncbi:patatin-like phospholipase family protein [Clostridioides sp. ZZV15-6388]|uniref:patatin-like phospholipase family protein n=1 Tax=unclassified Clostridioides TaxID=2635829 RepID=UPI001D10E3A9|nr:patatin-like phospholipase family protein [Clostridioides sp. ZZV15-6388]MCC0665483.1 patatin-like phospholipase family protein [Clostridioides sp. ZZV15-6597]
MKLGLCLEGGGAKGAYQAGVVKALYDNGINNFYSISGTSIGAMNGYYLYTGNVDNLEKMWTNIKDIQNGNVKIVNNTVDNSPVIDNLKELDDSKIEKMNFYVNYVEVNNKVVSEKVVNVLKMPKDEAILSISYSGLLPSNPNATLGFKEQFMKDVQDGIYDGFKLDGGLIRSALIEPLIVDNVDKIILISTKYNYDLPDDIKKIYNEDKIIVVRPNTQFAPKDTLNFDDEFCKTIYQEGYEIGKNILDRL